MAHNYCGGSDFAYGIGCSWKLHTTCRCETPRLPNCDPFLCNTGHQAYRAHHTACTAGVLLFQRDQDKHLSLSLETEVLEIFVAGGEW